MKNNNGAAIRRLSARSLKNNRIRNLFAMMAIILTGVLFTAVFSLTSGIMQVTQEEIMQEVGKAQRAKARAGVRVIPAEPDGWDREHGLSMVLLWLTGAVGSFGSLCGESCASRIPYPKVKQFYYCSCLCYNETLGTGP